MPYASIANSALLYAIGGLVILFVLIQSALFLCKAWKRGVAMGMTDRNSGVPSRPALRFPSFFIPLAVVILLSIFLHLEMFVLMVIGVPVSILAARLMYKSGWIKGGE